MAGTDAARRYDDAEREEALRLYVELGPAEAARRTGIPAGTVRSWAVRSGATGDRTAKATASVEAARLSWAQRRAEIKTRAGEAAAGFLERAIGAEGTRDVRNLMGGFAVAVDKAQLLDGEATERVEVSADERRQRVAKLRDDLAARRQGKAADGGEA